MQIFSIIFKSFLKLSKFWTILIFLLIRFLRIFKNIEKKCFIFSSSFLNNISIILLNSSSNKEDGLNIFLIADSIYISFCLKLGNKGKVNLDSFLFIIFFFSSIFWFSIFLFLFSWIALISLLLLFKLLNFWLSLILFFKLIFSFSLISLGISNFSSLLSLFLFKFEFISELFVFFLFFIIISISSSSSKSKSYSWSLLFSLFFNSFSFESSPLELSN